eukprot:658500-Pyramimonas_sp.AAC.1
MGASATEPAIKNISGIVRTNSERRVGGLQRGNTPRGRGSRLARPARLSLRLAFRGPQSRVCVVENLYRCRGLACRRDGRVTASRMLIFDLRRMCDDDMRRKEESKGPHTQVKYN